MRTPSVVEGEIAADRVPRLGHAGIGAEVDFLVLDRPPEALNEDVVVPGALALHADGDLGSLQHLDEINRGELGGFKWSLQHLDKGGCGEYSKAAFGSLRARCVAVTGS